jgi:coenzyme F420-reducing hydrogenase gamma subunit
MLLITVAWLAGAFGCGAALASLYKRLHPSLSFYKLWAFWTMVLSAVAAVLLAVV